MVGPSYIIAVDNGSTDGTGVWLREQEKLGRIDYVSLLGVNKYPGFATNWGWRLAIEQQSNADFLMRVDNDMQFYQDWDMEVEKYFKTFPNLGLLGLDYNSIKGAPKALDDFGWRPFYNRGPNFNMPVRTKKKGLDLVHWPGSVGGLCVIKREIWDKGVRYSERPWYDGGENFIAPQEDSMFTMNVLRQGYEVGHIGKKVAETFGDIEHWDEYPDYSLKVLKQRGYQRMFPEQIKKLEKP